MVLHANELGPAILLGNGLHHGELVGPHGARANVADLAALDKVVESFHSLFDRRVFVEAVDLQQVDIARLQSSQGCVYGGEDRRSREAYRERA